MNTSLQNKISARTSEIIGCLHPLVQQMKQNLGISKERTEDRKEELKGLKKEFATIMNELIQKEKIHNIVVPGLGWMYDQTISGDMPVNLMINIYTTLNDFYNHSSGTLSSSLIQEKREDLSKLLYEEEGQSTEYIGKNKKQELWDSLGTLLGIPNLSPENYEQVLNNFGDKEYTPGELHMLLGEIKYIKRDSAYILDSKARDCIQKLNKYIENALEISKTNKKEELWKILGQLIGIPNISAENHTEILKEYTPKYSSSEEGENILTEIKELKKHHGYVIEGETKEFLMHINKVIKDSLEAYQQKTRQETKKKSKEYAENIYFQNITCLDSFIVRAKGVIDQKAYNKYTTREELQNTTEDYQNFLALRKEFSEKYEKMVYQTYETLFKSDPTIDSFFYNSILGDLRRLGDIFSSKISNAQFFLGIKRNFILGDFYEFLGKYLPEIQNRNIEISPILSQELSHYAKKKPIIIF